MCSFILLVEEEETGPCITSWSGSEAHDQLSWNLLQLWGGTRDTLPGVLRCVTILVGWSPDNCCSIMNIRTRWPEHCGPDWFALMTIAKLVRRTVSLTAVHSVLQDYSPRSQEKPLNRLRREKCEDHSVRRKLYELYTVICHLLGAFLQEICVQENKTSFDVIFFSVHRPMPLWRWNSVTLPEQP